MHVIASIVFKFFAHDIVAVDPCGVADSVICESEESSMFHVRANFTVRGRSGTLHVHGHTFRLKASSLASSPLHFFAIPNNTTHNGEGYLRQPDPQAAQAQSFQCRPQGQRHGACYEQSSCERFRVPSVRPRDQFAYARGWLSAAQTCARNGGSTECDHSGA